MTKRMAIVLAAGKGTRMKSDLPKVLCEVQGRPMVAYVLDALAEAGVERVVVVIGYRGELVQAALADRPAVPWPAVEFAVQSEQLGTGHAVMMCREALASHQGPVAIVTGDSPLTQASSLSALFDEFDRSQPACILGTLLKQDPTGLGRILRDESGEFVGIVEEKDATPAQRAIQEVNMSTYVFDAELLLETLDQLGCDNQQQEYYITDCPGILKRQQRDVRALPVLKACEALSVNTVEDLAEVERALREGIK